MDRLSDMSYQYVPRELITTWDREIHPTLKMNSTISRINSSYFQHYVIESPQPLLSESKVQFYVGCVYRYLNMQYPKVMWFNSVRELDEYMESREMVSRYVNENITLPDIFDSWIIQGYNNVSSSIYKELERFSGEGFQGARFRSNGFISTFHRTLISVCVGGAFDRSKFRALIHLWGESSVDPSTLVGVVTQAAETVQRWLSIGDDRMRGDRLRCNLVAALSNIVAETTLFIPCEDVVFLVRKPVSAKTTTLSNGTIVPSNLDGPALIFRDDHRCYAHQGVAFPAHIIEAPEKITVREIDNTGNVEVRRMMIRKYGLVKFMKDANAKVVDIYRGNVKGLQSAKLYERFEVNDEPIKLLEVHDCTPENGEIRVYHLRVPPTVRTVVEAVRWTWGLPDSIDYSTTQET